jgi:general secretion pathway protein J
MTEEPVRGKSNKIRCGFTLFEVVVASVIGAFIAMTAVAALRGVTISREKLAAIDAGASESRYAANMIRTDLENIYRDRSTSRMKLVGSVEESGAASSSRIIFYAVSTAKARAELPEGDVYEVEYFVMPGEQKSTLCRRLWPNPSENYQPGGVVTMVSENLMSFEVRYYDGQNWLWEWPEGQNLPDMIEVRLAVKGEEGKEPVKRSILVNVRLLQERPEGMNVLDQADDSDTSSDSGTGT